MEIFEPGRSSLFRLTFLAFHSLFRPGPRRRVIDDNVAGRNSQRSIGREIKKWRRRRGRVAGNDVMRLQEDAGADYHKFPRRMPVKTGDVTGFRIL